MSNMSHPTAQKLSKSIPALPELALFYDFFYFQPINNCKDPPPSASVSSFEMHMEPCCLRTPNHTLPSPEILSLLMGTLLTVSTPILSCFRYIPAHQVLLNSILRHLFLSEKLRIYFFTCLFFHLLPTR